MKLVERSVFYKLPPGVFFNIVKPDTDLENFSCVDLSETFIKGNSVSSIDGNPPNGFFYTTILSDRSLTIKYRDVEGVVDSLHRPELHVKNGDFFMIWENNDLSAHLNAIDSAVQLLISGKIETILNEK